MLAKNGSDFGVFKERRDALRAAAERDLDLGIDGRELCLRVAERSDALLREAWERATGAIGVGEAELVAVGSYGRGTLGPLSDLDLRILVPGARGAELADALLYPLWDGGFSIGHQVLDPKELSSLASQDLATATSVLDMRHIAGAHLAKNVRTPSAARLLTWLREDADGRQQRFGGSVYLLEPEIKLGTGGLRDIDAVRWALRVTNRSLGDWDAAGLAAAEELLLRLRNRLHLRAKRRSERLSFDAQEALAIAMGYGADVAEAAERLMQDYYRAARVVSRLRERVLSPPVKRSQNVDLGRGLVLISGHVGLEDGALARDPAAALRLYRESARSNRPVWPESKDAIARACVDAKFGERLRASSEAAQAFVELLCVVRDVPALRGSPIAELHDSGLLVAMIPEFLPVTGRVHHDVYHVLTVDAHSVAAVDCLRALCRGELATEHPIATHLAAEMDHPMPLFVATLLHDFGKGYPDARGSRKDHSLRGAELCDVVLPRLGLSEADARRARALVLHHLGMYHVAARRDLDDPATIAEFAKIAPSRQRLRDLYLLTIADITTTSPTAMTSWKARMLEQLFLRADAHLAGKASEHVGDLARQIVSAARPEEQDAVSRFLRGMPERYLAAHPPASIVRHARIVFARRGLCAVELVPARHQAALELVVVAFDAPGLLAKIAASLTANRLEVLAAHIHSLERHGAAEALDVFFVRPLKEGPVDPLVAGAKRDLERMLRGDIEPEALLAERLEGSPWRERPNPSVPTRIVIDCKSSEAHTIVEVITKDRPGVLFALARALQGLGLSIGFAKVSTEGAKAIDVFYVADERGSKVESTERLEHIRDTLQGALSLVDGMERRSP